MSNANAITNSKHNFLRNPVEFIVKQGAQRKFLLKPSKSGSSKPLIHVYIPNEWNSHVNRHNNNKNQPAARKPLEKVYLYPKPVSDHQSSFTIVDFSIDTPNYLT